MSKVDKEFEENKRLNAEYEDLLFDIESILEGEVNELSEERKAEIQQMAKDGTLNKCLRSPEDWWRCDGKDEENDNLLGDEAGLEDCEEGRSSYRGYRQRREKILVEMRAFGVKNELENEDVFHLAKDLWEGRSVSNARRWGRYSYDGAMRLLLEAKVNATGDLEKYVEVCERIISTYEGDMGDIKYVRWKLADSYYILEQYDKALTIYKSLLSTEKSIMTRPPLACQILNIKMKAGLKIDAQDLMMLAKPSDYNMTFAVFNSLMSRANEYLNMILDGLAFRGMTLSKVIEDSCLKEQPFECFYRISYVQQVLIKEGKDYRFSFINPLAEPLKGVLDALFAEVKFLGLQLKDVDGIQDDWVESLELYYRLSKAFPQEEIIHHYRAPWLWKFQIAIYFPRLKYALDYRGRRVQESSNYTRQSGGQDEYLRLCDRTMKKANDKYGIQVDIVDAENSFEKIVSLVEEHGG